MKVGLRQTHLRLTSESEVAFTTTERRPATLPDRVMAININCSQSANSFNLCNIRGWSESMEREIVTRDKKRCPKKGPRLQPVFADHPSRSRYDSTSQYSTRWRYLAHLLTNRKAVVPASEIPSTCRGFWRLRYNRAFHRTLLPHNATGAPCSQGMLEILTSVSWRPEWTRMKKNSEVHGGPGLRVKDITQFWILLRLSKGIHRWPEQNVR